MDVAASHELEEGLDWNLQEVIKCLKKIKIKLL